MPTSRQRFSVRRGRPDLPRGLTGLRQPVAQLHRSRHDGRTLAAGVRCPILLAWGRTIRSCPGTSTGGAPAERFLPQAQTVTFPGAGHQPFIERP